MAGVWFWVTKHKKRERNGREETKGKILKERCAVVNCDVSNGQEVEFQAEYFITTSYFIIIYIHT